MKTPYVDEHGNPRMRTMRERKLARRKRVHDSFPDTRYKHGVKEPTWIWLRATALQNKVTRATIYKHWPELKDPGTSFMTSLDASLVRVRFTSRRVPARWRPFVDTRFVTNQHEQLARAADPRWTQSPDAGAGEALSAYLATLAE